MVSVRPPLMTSSSSSSSLSSSSCSTLPTLRSSSPYLPSMDEIDAEADAEHAASLWRIRQEHRHEQQELLKAMCNDPRANRIAASVGARQMGCEEVLLLSDRTPAFAHDVRAAIGLEEDRLLGNVCASVGSVERADLERRKEQAALAVQSMHTFQSYRRQSGPDPDAVIGNRPTVCLRRRARLMESQRMPHRAQSMSSIVEEDLEAMLCERSIEHHASAQSWRRVWGRRPASPQRIRTASPRRGSLPELIVTTTCSPQCSQSASSFSCTHVSSSESGVHRGRASSRASYSTGASYPSTTASTGTPRFVDPFGTLVSSQPTFPLRAASPLAMDATSALTSHIQVRGRRMGADRLHAAYTSTTPSSTQTARFSARAGR